MEAVLSILVPLVLAVSAVRAMVTPVKIAAHALAGFACLWLLNTTAFFTGIYLPMNAVTVLIAGFLGLPGIGVIAFLSNFGKF